MQIRSLGQEDPLEEGMAIHSKIPAWGIPWIEEPGELQSLGSQRVGHDRRDLARIHFVEIWRGRLEVGCISHTKDFVQFSQFDRDTESR